MTKMSKIIPILIVILFVVVSYNTFLKLNRDNSSVVPLNTQIRIAACPTCYKLLKNIDNTKITVIPTSSTAESFSLLSLNQVDLIFAGRTLKPTEDALDSIVIKEGYSFLANKELIVYEDILADYDLYTDLDVELTKKEFSIENLNKVDDVYQYMDKGIVITSWDNTDYTLASVVHLYKLNGERHELSRRPTIYCPSVCQKEAQELAIQLK